VALAQPLEMQKELLEKAELRCLPMRPGRARGEINGDHPESAEARLDVAPFGVELAAGEAAPHLVGCLPAVERHAAVALLLGEGVAAFVELEPVQLRIQVDLVAVQLVGPDDVRLLRGYPAS